MNTGVWDSAPGPRADPGDGFCRNGVNQDQEGERRQSQHSSLQPTSWGDKQCRQGSFLVT